ncbi:hypothetical protein AB0H82_04680 [Streptomyces sp. NPDC050732]|uniref:hypothetical protein n=1 Tax=Streptomyces sp. NPDC050732 TaxID=3154632 RepID=UPI003414F566
MGTPRPSRRAAVRPPRRRGAERLLTSGEQASDAARCRSSSRESWSASSSRCWACAADALPVTAALAGAVAAALVHGQLGVLTGNRRAVAGVLALTLIAWAAFGLAAALLGTVRARRRQATAPGPSRQSAASAD